jgi:hypothetical protein
VKLKLIAILGASSLVLSFAVFAGAPLPDTDGDGVPDEWDNCLIDPNPTQTDCDWDGYGHACDCDFDNNGGCGASDFGLLAAAFLSSDGDANFDACIDCDDNGGIGASDFACLATGFLGAPGPSGLPCAGTIPCHGI